MDKEEKKVNDKMRFSVVIPLYNKDVHIVPTLHSVLAQTFNDFEVIVIDDGSTDNSFQQAKSVLDSRIKIVQQNNQGESAARNRGIEESSTDYIAFLDADDYWREDHLSVLADLIDDYPCANIFSTMHEIYFDGKTIEPKFAYPKNFKGVVDDFFIRFSYGLSLINASTACVSKKALLSEGAFPVGVAKGGDLIVWINIAQRYMMAHASVITAVYNRDAINRTVLLESEFEPPASLVLLAKILSDNRGKSKAKSVLCLFSNIAFYTSAGMCESGDKRGYRSILKLVKELGLWPLYIKILFLGMVPKQIFPIARFWRHK